MDAVTALRTICCPGRHPMRLQLASALLLPAVLLLPVMARAQVTAPAGWQARTADGTLLLVPSALTAGSVLSIAVFASQDADARTPAAWLEMRANADAAGVATARVDVSTAVTSTAAGIHSTSRVLVTPSGARLLSVYYAIEAPQAQRQMVRVLTSSAALLREHEAVVTTVIQQCRNASPAPVSVASAVQPAAPISAPSAVEAVTRVSGNVLVRTPAPRRAGIRSGGPLVPGMYVGRQLYSDTREVINEMTLWLHGNGEYRQQWKNRRGEPRTGEFAYDPSTGRIDLEWGSLMDIVNSRIEPNTDFAVLGTADNGSPTLLAENDRGFHTMLTVLVRAGPNDRPSPSAEKAAIAAAEAEAARYKYVVAPGQGVQESQIAAIHLHTEMHQTLGLSMQLGVSSTLSLYLLLTDGTIHDGLPVAPDEMDVITSRRREPEKWGRWRRQGATVEVAWNVAPTVWAPLEGNPVVPFRAGEELRGRFSGGESFAGGDVSSFSLYGVTFGAGRTFETDSRGGTGTGNFTQVTGGTSVQTTRDDEGSVTSVSTPGAIATASTRAAAAARTGTYRVSGWNLEARYADGRVVRQPVFFVDADRDAIYWQGKIVNLNTGAR